MDNVSLIPLSLFHASTCCVGSVAVVDWAALVFLMSDVPFMPLLLFHYPVFFSGSLDELYNLD